MAASLLEQVFKSAKVLRRWVAALWLAALLTPHSAALAGETGEKGQWVAVVAPGLRAAVEPLIEQRRQEGLRVVVIETSAVLTPEQIRAGDAALLVEKVRQAWQGAEGPVYVLLAGTPLAAGLENPEKFVVPALPGSVGRMKAQWTDNPYGCAKGELLPRAAVGRLPARTAAEAAAMVRKTLAWETQRSPGAWKRRLVLLAGAPSYNEVVDKMVEQLALSGFGKLDPIWTGNVIYRNPNSYYTAPDARVFEQATAYLTAGQALTLYLGHSSAAGFWYDRHSKQSKRIEKTTVSLVGGPDGGSPAATNGAEISVTPVAPLFGRDHWAGLRLPPARGVFITVGCYGAQYAGDEGEGYGLAAMRNADGPVAVIGSHGSCYAAMALLLTEGLLGALPKADESVRLGSLWLAMRRNLDSGPMSPFVFHALDTVDGAPTTTQEEQRREHHEMFLLLGDPATRFAAYAREFPLEIAGAAKPGAVITVRATVPPELAGATARVTLERTLTSPPAGIEPLSKELSPEARDGRMAENHARSNHFVLAETTVKLEGQALRAEIKIPAALPWETVLVRAVVSTDTADGVAVKSVAVKKAE